MDEQSYTQGGNAARIGIMMHCLRGLGFEDAEAAGVAHVAWIGERQAAITALRDLCDDFGDNDWPDTLYLGDIIEKHLARPLYRARPQNNTFHKSISQEHQIRSA